MKRKLIPGGEFCGMASVPTVKRKKSAFFTVTAYDRAGRLWIGLAHYNCDGDGRGSDVYRVKGELETGGAKIEVKTATVSARDFVGKVIRENAVGAGGTCIRFPEREETETGRAHEGPARVLNEVFPGGGVDVELAENWPRERLPDGQGGSDPVDFAARFPQEFLPPAGCSGSPVIQDGKIVGAIWGRSNIEKNIAVCRDIRKMLDRLDRKESET